MGCGNAFRSAEPEPDCLVPPGCAWPIVLGVDPGTLVVGWGAVALAPDGPRMVASGVVRPARRLAVALRLDHIRTGIERALERCRPNVVAVERVFAALNVQSALRIGEGRGVVLACAARSGAQVVEYTPAEAKKSVVGNGRATKQQVARMVAEILCQHDLALPEDATDALAVALAHVRRLELALRLGRVP